MSVNSDKVKIIFGLKIRQLRLDKKLSLSEVAEKSNLSISYLNEIEKGKKYPKTEKIMALSEALEIDYDSLVSLKLSKQLEPIAELLNSNILTELPLEIFGVEPSDFIELMSEAPAKISAFISTIIEISRNYDMRVEQFYFSVLRSYQEMYDNYFEDLEQSAQQFRRLFEITPTTSPNEKLLAEILENFYGYHIEEFSKEEYPDLVTIRSVYDPKTSKLLINKDLSTEQKTFTYGREIGYQFLQLKKRSYISSVIEVDSFEQVLNNFKASYFAGAILINKNILVDRLTYFFASPKWDENMLLSIMRLFNVTPEVFMHRLSNLMTSHFKINNLFFLRFNNQVGDDLFYLTKEMHLAKLHTPHGTALNEHYCRRWMSLTVLKDLEKSQKENGYNPEEVLCKAQISEYIDTGNNYLVICLAKPSPPNLKMNSSVTLGFAIDDNLKSIANFLPDSSLIHRKVNETCERCGAVDCADRMKPPYVLQKRQAREKIKEAILKLNL
ncbi:helix-turn-helix domain-containing protein [Arcicella rigui]|uniref:XRE family transcriptional regulator n=1 Tax=Arcicella rigui TaxID=797020 RepID=A0ABU5Q9H3_9BACT|nr:XRE family transcriptional regulator [Arcicella rigui]MEA5139495.1 XRE family transcriptional regulator [Arcicella rigui]